MVAPDRSQDPGQKSRQAKTYRAKVDMSQAEGDDSITFENPSQAAPSKPAGTDSAQQFLKFTDKLAARMWSSATVALLRVFSSPPAAPLPPNADTLPKWYIDDYQKRAKFKSYGTQYIRDTLLLTAATYVMEGVETATKAVRGGTDDPLNKIMGGVAAGGVVGYAWFPQRYPARLIMTTTGALVGYVSYAAEKTSRVVLLEQQRKLEKEVTGANDDQLHQELDTDFLRDLIRQRQRQLADEAAAGRAQGGPGASSALPGGPQPSSLPPWVLNTDTNTQQASSSSTASSSTSSNTSGQQMDGSSPPSQDPWPVSASRPPPQDDTYTTSGFQSDNGSGSSSGTAPPAAAPSRPRPSAWGSLFGGGRQQGGAQGGAAGRGAGGAPKEMEIRDESEGGSQEPAWREDPPR